ncbi:MAG: H4MPT-linked C1 transfer pathway protein [Burkholderiales bacterium]|nr:H4MPT-linked C1 transfer pathway protein [Burkholderiales bacterium]
MNAAVQQNPSHTTLGWDLGGAHVKRVALDEKGRVLAAEQVPCKLWLGLEHLAAAVRALDRPGTTAHAVTMTGELVDLFADRASGVERILRTFNENIAPAAVHVFAGDAFIDAMTATARWMDVASANWRATAQFVARNVSDALVLDIGSTTTDVIPVSAGRIVRGSRDDHGRLTDDSLVYTGAVRTPLMAIAERMPFRGKSVALMAEWFATTADVHRILGDLDPAFDHADTADGRSRSTRDSMGRLARMIGCDVEAASEADWIALAKAFADRQLDRIVRACERQVADCRLPPDAPIVGLGAGRFLCRRAAVRLGRAYVDFARLTDAPDDLATAVEVCGPAFAVGRLWMDRP